MDLTDVVCVSCVCVLIACVIAFVFAFRFGIPLEILIFIPQCNYRPSLCRNFTYRGNMVIGTLDVRYRVAVAVAVAL